MKTKRKYKTIKGWCFCVLEANTKTAKDIKKHYEYILKTYGERDIYDEYKNPSIYKVRAFASIKELKRKTHGKGLTITGANSSVFSCGFTIKDGLCFFTRQHNYFIKGE